jgi:hypothetical protein
VLKAVSNNLHRHFAQLRNFELNSLIEEVGYCVQVQEFAHDVIIEVN